MCRDESNEAFLNSVEFGEESALGRVCRDFQRRLLELAERKICHRLRRVYDADDAVVSALHSFCRRARNGEYHFDHTGGLRRLLEKITLNKIRRAGRRFGLEQFALDADEEGGEPIAREPTAAEVAEHIETVEATLVRFQRLVARLRKGDETEQRDAKILQAWADGLSRVEIAKTVYVCPTTVSNVVNKYCRRIRREIEEGES